MRNSMKYQSIQADTTTKFLRDHIRDYCEKRQFKGSRGGVSVLCDLYNKTFQLNDKGLFWYLDTKVSNKLFTKLINSY